MSLRLSLLVYNLLLPLAMLAMLPGYIGKLRRRGKPAGHLRERFAFYPDETRKRLAGMDRPVWFHAVSVGEVGIAKRLIDELRARAPDTPVVLSTTTTTGYAVARERCGKNAEVIFNPIDFRFAARRALATIQPRALVLVEAEVWPNLVSLTKKTGIPVLLANMRLSPRSERRYRRFRFLTAPLFSLVDHALVQHVDDIARCKTLGVPDDRITCSGSVKFDPDGDTAPTRAGEFRQLTSEFLPDPSAPVLLAASTHPGEEKLVGKVVVRLREDFPALACFLAPRHFERAEEVVADFAEIPIKPVRRTQMEGRTGDTLLIDTTGELRDWFDIANIVIIGKSFLGTGGQNPVEAIAAGKPVVFGPHMENFPQITEDLLRAKGAIQVADAAELESVLRNLLRNPEQREKTASAGAAVLGSHRGATVRSIDVLQRLTPSFPAGLEKSDKT